MNALKLGLSRSAVASPEVAAASLVNRATQHSRAALVLARDVLARDVLARDALARDAEERTTGLSETLSGLLAAARSQSPRVAIRVSGKILFIHLGDVVSVQSEGKCVWMQRNASCYLLRASISVVAKQLETHGFIRIHRSVLVNSSFVEEIQPLSTGEYCLRIAGGKEYRVTRTYKKNLKSLAEFWIGTGRFFPG